MLFNYTYERYNEETGEEETFKLEVVLYHEPTEYEGGYLFVRGGFEIESIKHNGEDFHLDANEEESILNSIIREHDLQPEEHHYRASWL